MSKEEIVGNGLPKDLDKFEDGQHPIIKVLFAQTKEGFFPYRRIKETDDLNNGYIAVFVILGDSFNVNSTLPEYCRIRIGDFIDAGLGIFSLMDIKEGKTLINDRGKIIEIF